VNFSVEVWFGREEHEFMGAYMAGIGPVLEIVISYHFASGTEYSIFMYISTHHPHTLNTILKGQSHEIFELRFFSSNISP
jgi:hypothetical protein